MAAEKAIQMLESALHSFKVGDENASTTLLQA